MITFGTVVAAVVGFVVGLVCGRWEFKKERDEAIKDRESWMGLYVATLAERDEAAKSRDDSEQVLAVVRTNRDELSAKFTECEVERDRLAAHCKTYEIALGRCEAYARKTLEAVEESRKAASQPNVCVASQPNAGITAPWPPTNPIHK